jgi:phage shock protein E
MSHVSPQNFILTGQRRTARAFHFTAVVAAITLLACAGPLGAAEAGKTNDSPSIAATTKGYKDVSVEQFEQLRSDKKNIVLDVRTPEEFAAGHIPGAKNIDFHSPDFQKRVNALDKSKTYLVHCAAGGRSAAACGKLSRQNFRNCYGVTSTIRPFRWPTPFCPGSGPLSWSHRFPDVLKACFTTPFE